MSRKKKPADDGPSNAYLLSFGDTMTALLAFFIVLNSLAQEQTGANLHAGTGSFANAGRAMGFSGRVPGSGSDRVDQRRHLSPKYIASDEEGDRADEGEGGEMLNARILDYEQEQFDRFLNEMDRFYSVSAKTGTKGEVVFDTFDRLNAEGPLLSDDGAKVLNKAVPLLLSDGYEIEVVVWATMPSRIAITRAVEQSSRIVREFSRDAALGSRQRSRIKPIGRPWMDSVAKRPIVSIIVSRLSEG